MWYNSTMNESQNNAPVYYEQLTPEQQRERWEQAGQTALRVAAALRQAAEKGYTRTPELDLLADGMLALSADESVAAFINKEEFGSAAEISIWDLDLPVLLKGQLSRHDIETIRDLLPLSYKDILGFNNVGPRFVAHLRKQLEEHGITLCDK
jgi:DNA-directed RNA polymerase alpha subunit